MGDIRTFPANTTLEKAHEKNPAKKKTVRIVSFLDILQSEFSSSVRFNVLTYQPEGKREGVWRPWTDADDANLRLWFQEQHDLYAPRLLDDAFKIFLRQHEFNPIKDYVDSLAWDGVHRIEYFLPSYAGCDDTPYTREVSRLCFAGGIHRLYDPGCKFDSAITLVGPQGTGKSTLVQWLALCSEWYREITTIVGVRAIEGLEGGWICEIPELAALNRNQNDVIKAFLSRNADTYRVPWDKHPVTKPRSCVFIGTTNDGTFLTDKTGGRRFLPVVCHGDARGIYAHEKVIKEEIRQCWAEARELFRQGKLSTVPPVDLLEDFRRVQESVQVDDWREGQIAEFLARKEIGEATCVIELWRDALRMPDTAVPKQSDSREIMEIAGRIPGWVRTDERAYFPRYGRQRCLRKKADC